MPEGCGRDHAAALIAKTAPIVDNATALTENALESRDARRAAWGEMQDRISSTLR